MSKDRKTNAPQDTSEVVKMPNTSTTSQEDQRHWPLQRGNQDPKLYNADYKRGIH